MRILDKYINRYNAGLIINGTYVVLFQSAEPLEPVATRAALDDINETIIKEIEKEVG